VEILVQARERLGPRKILATAATNTAIDHITVQLVARGLQPLRVGERASGQAKKRSLEALLANDQGLNTAVRHSSKWQKRAMELINSADVICVTAAGAGQSLLNKLQFDLVVVDEAAQATEPCCLIPIMRASSSSRIVLVGDHKQLGPSVTPVAAELGLGQPLFGRLPVHYLLDTQYRMHPVLTEFSSKTFYQGKLASAVQPLERPLPPGFDWPNPKEGPVAFIQVAGRERLGTGGSKYNLEEVMIVVQIVKDLLAAKDFSGDPLPKKVKREDIGVITPYSAQVHALKTDIPPGVEVNTVDGFQGREKEVIIFSAVRCNGY